MTREKPTETIHVPEPFDEINPITGKIIAGVYKVKNTLGAGFLEKVYETALAHEVAKAGLKVRQQAPIQVMYDGIVAGDYYADLLVEDKVIVELKVVQALSDSHTAQCLNYFKATGLRICLLINLGNSEVKIKRIVR